MKEDRLRPTAANPVSPRWDLTPSRLSENQCDADHPILSRTWCCLPVGHGSFHMCNTRDGEGHQWG
jgi:hypothetical protein